MVTEIKLCRVPGRVKLSNILHAKVRNRKRNLFVGPQRPYAKEHYDWSELTLLNITLVASYILSSGCLRLGVHSTISFMHWMGLCGFCWPNFPRLLLKLLYDWLTILLVLSWHSRMFSSLFLKYIPDTLEMNISNLSRIYIGVNNTHCTPKWLSYLTNASTAVSIKMIVSYRYKNFHYHDHLVL